MSKPIYKDDLSALRLPISGDRSKSIALHKRKIAAAKAGKAKLTDHLYSGLAFLYEMEEETTLALEAVTEGLNWFPESQLLMLECLRLLVLEAKKSPEKSERIGALLDQLRPTSFEGAEKAAFDSFYFCLEKRRGNSDFTEVLLTSDSIKAKIDPDKRLQYGGGWEILLG